MNSRRPDVPAFAPGKIESPGNHSGTSGFAGLAARVERAWHEAGHPTVQAWVENDHGVLRLCSNLVNALPPVTVFRRKGPPMTRARL